MVDLGETCNSSISPTLLRCFVADVAYGTMTLDGPNGPVAVPAIQRKVSKSALWQHWQQHQKVGNQLFSLHRTTFFTILRSLGKHTHAQEGVDAAVVQFRESIVSLLALLDKICEGRPPFCSTLPVAAPSSSCACVAETDNLELLPVLHREIDELTVWLTKEFRHTLQSLSDYSTRCIS